MVASLSIRVLPSSSDYRYGGVRLADSIVNWSHLALAMLRRRRYSCVALRVGGANEGECTGFHGFQRRVEEVLRAGAVSERRIAPVRASEDLIDRVVDETTDPLFVPGAALRFGKDQTLEVAAGAGDPERFV